MSDPYGLVFRELMQPAWERAIRARPTLERVTLVRRTQWWSADELRAFQLRELRRLVQHAYEHVPYYRRSFKAISFEPAELRTLDDLSKLPLLDRDTARASIDERISIVPPSVEIRKMTSGSTGRPLAFGYDRGSECWRQALKLRGYSWAGYRPGDKTLHYWGSTTGIAPPSLARRLKISLDHSLKRERYIDCTDRSAAALERAVQSIREYEPRVIVCYARAGVALARHVLETSARLPSGISLICGAERLFPEDRRLLERAFRAPAFETYGSREVMLIACECEAHDGLHISMENLVVELLVRDGGRVRPADPGEVGEVVITDLHNFGAPFIRYLNGDLARAKPPGRCACGRGLDRLDAIEGRQTDTLHDAAGHPVSGLFFNVMFSMIADYVSVFQVVQRKDGSIDLSMVPDHEFNAAVVERIRAHFANNFRGTTLRVHVVPEIPVDPNGKFRVVKVED